MPARKDRSQPPSANLLVVARFLDRLSEPRKWTRASLQAACGVNYDIFRRYVTLLEEKGFVAATPQGGLRLTRKGVTWREQLRAVLADFLEHPPGTRGTGSATTRGPNGAGAARDPA